MDDRPKMSTAVHSYTVNQLAELVRTRWCLPAYQRPLVWEPEQAVRLVQSVYEGYPIGSLLVWQWKWGEDEMILDGQQRLAALTGVRAGTGEDGPQVGWSFLGQRWCLDPGTPGDDWLSLKWWQESEAYDRVMHLGELQKKYEGWQLFREI